MIIAVDFDGTCVTHAYPKIGLDIGAVPVLKRLNAAGHKLIIFTMRSGERLADAENWFHENSIEFWGSNCNPEQHTWSQSPKVYAHLYIDDAALGCPLVLHSEHSERPYVNWAAVETQLRYLGML